MKFRWAYNTLQRDFVSAKTHVKNIKMSITRKKPASNFQSGPYGLGELLCFKKKRYDDLLLLPHL
jgi:hypothetical protein